MLVTALSHAIFFGLLLFTRGERRNTAITVEESESISKKLDDYTTNKAKNIPSVHFKSETVSDISDRFSSEITHRLYNNSLRLYNGTAPSIANQMYDVMNFVNVTNKLQPKKIKRRRCPICSKYLQQMKTNQRSWSRFLEVFQIVQFEHVACTSKNGLEGTCLHEYECQSSGGTGMGECADQYGTCCVTLFPCDGSSAAPMGWFNNPDFPSPTSERLSCTFTLNKASEDIKQLRLEFAAFELLPPDGGVCQQDQFVVSGQNINNVLPIICGINTGQHIYIEVGDVEGPIYFAVQTVSAESRLFSIKITQLTLADELAAPSGCLQYFHGSEGYLESFNYRDKTDIGIARYPSYLNNLNYAICINREPQACSVTYTNEDYEMQIVNYDSDGSLIIPPNQAGVEIFNCPSDWLLIAATRLCGDRLNDGSVMQDFSLNAPVTDTNAGPIVVLFRSDEGYVGRGFKLHYQQNPCLNSSPR